MKNIISINATSVCYIEKFTKYIIESLNNNGKKQLFELWGYDIIDSEYLQKEFEKQAKLAYMIGNYELEKLNDYGQRINIEIKLKRKKR